MKLLRPDPPDPPETGERFLAAPDLSEWVRAAFLTESAPFWTDEHAHLVEAHIVWCWTWEEGRARGRQIIGEAQVAEPRGRQWSKLRDYDRIAQWWRAMPDYAEATAPDFVITLYAPWSAAAQDASFGATADHELFHCGQAVDGWGEPRVNASTGRPMWSIIRHDVEEFVAVARRWGVRGLPEVERLVSAARRPPEIAEAVLVAGCGTCARKAA